MEHTKTPWTYGGESFAYIEDANSEFVICSMKHPKGDFWKNYKANARRIVAAVNACEGIETEWLETGVNLKSQISDAIKERNKAYNAVMAEIAEKEYLQAQNARLLALLKMAADATESDFAHTIGFLDGSFPPGEPIQFDWLDWTKATRAAIAENQQETP